MDDGRLERLWAIHEMEQLAHRYAFAFDSRDVASYRRFQEGRGEVD